MASIKQLSDRKYKITISNGYRTDGRKICKAKTIQVPDSVPKRGVEQYVYHEAERLERLFKQGYSEDGEMTFETYARGWLERQTKYAPGTIAFYRRSLETVFPEIGAIKLNRLRPIALENLLAKLRKRTYRGKPIKEKTVQKYLTVVSAVLSDAKRNEIIEKNPSIKVVIDLHRDGVAETTRLAATIDGKPMAQIMFFNGLCRTAARGPINSLPNEYLGDNLAFSFQLQLMANEYYPGLARRIYLKGYRYNMHLCPKSLLVEVGAQTNTKEEAYNAMEPLADILDKVLK